MASLRGMTGVPGVPGCTIVLYVGFWLGQEQRMRLGLPEMLVILFIVLLIFGANRLPDLAKGVGKSIKNFKDAVKEGEEKKP